jgi:hypothetical protein
MSVMVRPKECEIYNAAASGVGKKSNGFIQLIMTNTGAVPAVYEQVTKYERSRGTITPVSVQSGLQNPREGDGS